MDNNPSADRNVQEIHTLLKFVPSERNGAMVSYVSTNPVSGQIKGVRVDSEYPHKIVVCSPAIAPIIMSGILYKVKLIPMHSNKGYVCIEAEPLKFRATVEQRYVPKETYQILVKFGNKTLVFDPYKGNKASVLTVNGFVDMLEHRVDLEDAGSIVAHFKYMSGELIKLMTKDGAKARIA